MFFFLLNTEKPMKKHGLAVTTNGDRTKVPSEYIIHVDVGDGHFKKRMVDALNKAEEMKLKTVAFPALGTGLMIIYKQAIFIMMVINMDKSNLLI